MMETRELTCIGCPIGCALSANIHEDNIKIKGNLCKKGIEYGLSECTDPRRVITTSIKVKLDNGTTKMLSVKTSRDIPKNRIFECLNEIKKVNITGNFKIGDVVIKNILGIGVDILATSALQSKES